MQIPKNNKFKDLTNLRFGKLTVIEYNGVKNPDNIKKKGHLWLCHCDCGNIKTILGDSLRNSGTISCGCVQRLKSSSRKIDISKQRFNKLLVQEFAYILKGQTFWKCVCDCGKEKIINGSSLRRGNTKSCGCLQGNYTHGMWGKPGYKKLYLLDPVKKN